MKYSSTAITPYNRIYLNGFLLIFSLSIGHLNAAVPAELYGGPVQSLAPMLEKIMPAVVNISTKTEIQMRDHPLMRDPFYRHFFGLPNQPRSRKRQSSSLGSGVIVDSRAGYVITNNHVIDKAQEITVTLQDGRTLNATLVGSDPESDVAVIKIAPQNLTAIPVADSEKLRVGDFVVAIGNPFGLGQTVTSGIISALGRSGLGIEGYEDFIQTDASINPGNSGGALVNFQGELIGINTAILAPSGGNVGIGFAIPSNMALAIKNTLIKHGEVQRGLLGVTVQDLSPELMRAFNLKNKNGAVISRVQSESPAEKAGLEPGDIVVSVNGRRVNNSASLRNAIGLVSIGTQITLQVIREGQRLTRTAVITPQKLELISGEKLHPTLEGVVLSTTQKNQAEGILIHKIDSASYAWRLGLRPGDIIVSANRYRVKNLDAFASVINKRQALLINIQRGNEAFFLILK